MRIKMWGVRGSIPSPGPDTVEFGGNTSCYEVRAGGALVILDGGTGLRMLGQDLLKQMPIEAWMFFSHVHWDHIQGFPFFSRPRSCAGTPHPLCSAAPTSRAPSKRRSRGRWTTRASPFTSPRWARRCRSSDLYEGEVVTVGPSEDVRITNARGNHPNGVYAYRVDHDGTVVVYITDSEHYAIVDPKLLRLARGADVLIFDAMYTPEEYAGDVGGGPEDGLGSRHVRGRV
jgi:phosphoribosyl 1,2-cyclic phosphodiesterase